MLLNYRRLRQKPEVVELNITAFLALMVILVPFLLLTVVFTPHSQIKTPLTKASEQPTETVVEPLVVTLQDNTITINDFAGVEQIIAPVNDGYAIEPLSYAMQVLKARFPQETTVRLLFAPSVTYADGLAAKQAVSGWRYRVNNRVKEYPLFPEISSGLVAERVANADVGASAAQDTTGNTISNTATGTTPTPEVSE